MALNFRKKIKIIPGVHLNLSKGGVSVSAGVKGASLTFRKDGTYVNAGLPGTGIYYRQKLNSPSNTSQNALVSKSQRARRGQQQITQADLSRLTFWQSDELSGLTSSGFEGLQRLILAAHEQRSTLKVAFQRIKNDWHTSERKLQSNFNFLYKLIGRNRKKEINSDIEKQKASLQQIQEQLKNSRVRIEVNFDNDWFEAYLNLVRAFTTMVKTSNIWDILAREEQIYFAGYDSGENVLRKIVKVGHGAQDDILCVYGSKELQALYLENANGGDFYFYPNFIIIRKTPQDFAVVKYSDVRISAQILPFVETRYEVPDGAKMIKNVWLYSNKDGSPDRRYKKNVVFPCLSYGLLDIQSDSGISERYLFTNADAALNFAQVFQAYQSFIPTGD
ncbi:MAG: DUF4236 domain-containing protein [Bernardetiaceae bacterium]|nr:DUF4236 domain-containing protein [Bernardetiaceae bacterium]